MQRLKEHGIELGLNKCEFSKDSVQFLGFRVTGEVLKPAPEMVKSLMEAKVPINLTQLRSFLGAYSFYRRFIPNFATIVSDLVALTEGYSAKVKGVNVPVNCDEKCLQAFQKLKEIMSKEIVLQYPDFSKPFHLYTDASDNSIGAWVGQEENGDVRPIVFLSRSLSKAERNFPVIEKENLSIIWALRSCRPFLLGARIQIKTDARSLIYLFKYAHPSSRHYRWMLTI